MSPPVWLHRWPTQAQQVRGPGRLLPPRALESEIDSQRLHRGSGRGGQGEQQMADDLPSVTCGNPRVCEQPCPWGCGHPNAGHGREP